MPQKRGPQDSVAIQPIRGFTKWRTMMAHSYDSLAALGGPYRTSIIESETGRSDPLLRTMWSLSRALGLDVYIGLKIYWDKPISTQFRAFLKKLKLTSKEAEEVTGVPYYRFDYVCGHSNVSLATLREVLEPLGFQLAIVPIEEEHNE